jgi:hypothetical protein
MREILYNLNSVQITIVLFVCLVLAIEVGYRIGRRTGGATDEEAKSHINAIQASLLGVLALLLGFTFSISLQRYDSRSEAVIDEANAIGTTYLRAQLLPISIRREVKEVLRDYVEVRIQEGNIPLSNQGERQALLNIAAQNQAVLWRYALQAAEEDKSPVTSGLFIQTLNELIDSYGRRNAALDRHVPEIVMILLFCTFILTWGVVGYSSGIGGNRVSLAAYTMLVLIVLLVFIIIDLDRPRRGLIRINHESLVQLRDAIAADQELR